MEETLLLNSPKNPETSGGKRGNDSEHTRQLLYEILKQRGIYFDSTTGEKIDEKSDIETLLRVIQNEKEKISPAKSSPSSEPENSNVQKYDFSNGFWKLIDRLYKLW